MAHQLQQTNSAGGDKTKLPAEFIAICVIAFIASVLATAYFCGSGCGGMRTPGGWTISVMWIRMPGETWLASTLNFLLMWLAMMVAMMMPSALPMFLKTHRRSGSLCYMASGYFAIWLIAGVVIYVLGVAFAMATMRSELFCRAVPLLSGALLVAAGVVQLTRRKMTQLSRCRSPLGCSSSASQDETSFWLGCKQGAACCLSCTGPMTMQLALGLMNPVVMIVFAIVVGVEKFLPRPEITTRLIGIAAFFVGFTMILQPSWMSFPFFTTTISCRPND